MKRTVYEYTSATSSDALLGSVGERVVEYNVMQGDRRALITLRDCDAEGGKFTLLVREGATPEGNLDLSVSVAPGEGGGSVVSGKLAHNPADGKPTFGTRLYGLFLSCFARLTALALFYGAVLGVSYLFPGRNFWVPAIPPSLLLVLMVTRAVLIRRRLPNRIDKFFIDFCGATPCENKPPQND